MPKQTVMVDYRKCRPEECEAGVCLAVQACPKDLLTQEASYEMPDPNPTWCIGCGFCVQACPLKAVLMVRW